MVGGNCAQENAGTELFCVLVTLLDRERESVLVKGWYGDAIRLACGKVESMSSQNTQQIYE